MIDSRVVPGFGPCGQERPQSMLEMQPTVAISIGSFLDMM
jgi:hypothetical protein